mmetsp:Transcript_15104/g.32027  ORF Transcript_15104/g.32027 Transcript_15104/m.32027 type:complete len:305 (+) Transcript_15104:202-1116(+)
MKITKSLLALFLAATTASATHSLLRHLVEMTPEELAAAAAAAGIDTTNMTPEEIQTALFDFAGVVTATGLDLPGEDAGGDVDFTALVGCFSSGDPSACCTPPADGSGLDPLTDFFCVAIQCVDMTTLQIYEDADPAICNCGTLTGSCAGAATALANFNLGGICTAVDGCCSAPDTTNEGFNVCMETVAESGDLGFLSPVLAGLGIGGGAADGAGGGAPVPVFYNGTEPVPELISADNETEPVPELISETGAVDNATETEDESAAGEDTTTEGETPDASTTPDSSGMRPIALASMTIAALLAMAL